MATSLTDFDHPVLEILYSKSVNQRIDYFTKEKGNKMKFVSLGEALDFVSLGGTNHVLYPLGTKDMTRYIRTWMRAQKPRIEYEKVYLDDNQKPYTHKEIKREYNYLWNRFHRDFNHDLPRINYSKCPKSAHSNSKTFQDIAGRTRCLHTETYEKKPSFTHKEKDVDVFSQTNKYLLTESEPMDPTPDEWVNEEGKDVDWSEEYDDYLVQKEKFDE